VAKTYEVWDTESFNRVGSFLTRSEAEAFLRDVLRENGPEVAAEMSIVSYADAGSDPVLVLEGATFVEQSGALA
jgi:hypothetical protein